MILNMCEGRACLEILHHHYVFHDSDDWIGFFKRSCRNGGDLTNAVGRSVDCQL